MIIEEFDISVDRSLYFAGETITGTINFTVNETLPLSKIEVFLHGSAGVFVMTGLFFVYNVVQVFYMQAFFI